MSTKPYQSTGNDTQLPHSVSSFLGFGVFEWICIVILSALGVSVAIHYSLIDDLTAYRNSPLIGVEIVSLLLAFASVPVHLVRAIYFVIRGRFRRTASSTALAVATIAIAIWAMWYDAPTILYAT